MKAKLNLIIALTHQAEFLMLDEPTAGMDVMVREQIIWILTFVPSLMPQTLHILGSWYLWPHFTGERNVKLEELASLRLLLFLGAV